jgi:hypothetical protein
VCVASVVLTNNVFICKLINFNTSLCIGLVVLTNNYLCISKILVRLWVEDIPFSFDTWSELKIFETELTLSPENTRALSSIECTLVCSTYEYMILRFRFWHCLYVYTKIDNAFTLGFPLISVTPFFLVVNDITRIMDYSVSDSVDRHCRTTVSGSYGNGSCNLIKFYIISQRHLNCWCSTPTNEAVKWS